MSVERPPQRHGGWVGRVAGGFRQGGGTPRGPQTHAATQVQAGPQVHLVDGRHAALHGERRAGRPASVRPGPSVARALAAGTRAVAASAAAVTAGPVAVPVAVLAAGALALAGGRVAAALAAWVLVAAMGAAALDGKGRLGLPPAFRRELTLLLAALGAVATGAVMGFAGARASAPWTVVAVLLALGGGALLVSRLRDAGARRRWAALFPWLVRNARAAAVGAAAGAGTALVVLAFASRAGGVELQCWLVLAVTMAWVPLARNGLLASLRTAVLDGDAGPRSRRRVRQLLAGFAGPYAVLALLPWIMGSFGAPIAPFCGLGAVLALAVVERMLGQETRAAIAVLAAGVLVVVGAWPGAVLAGTFALLALDLMVLGGNLPRLGVRLFGAGTPAGRAPRTEVPRAG